MVDRASFPLLPALPEGPTFRLVLEPCPAPAKYDPTVDVRAYPTDATCPILGLCEASGDACDAIRAAYRAQGVRFGLGHTSEGRYGDRCAVTYAGPYRVWTPMPEAVPFRPDPLEVAP